MVLLLLHYFILFLILVGECVVALKVNFDLIGFGFLNHENFFLYDSKDPRIRPIIFFLN